MTTGSLASIDLLLSYEREVARAGAYLHALDANAWSRATRCPPMTVLDLAAHLRGGLVRISDLLTAGPVEGSPEKNGASYFHFDRAQVAPQVLTRAQADASAFGGGAALLAAWDESIQVIARTRSTLEQADAVYSTVHGRMRLSEFLRTRVLEMTVHHMDLRAAFGDSPDPDPRALQATAEVLRDILGADLHSLGFDDLRFSLIGTGRDPLTIAERDTLGSLADRFPLMG